MVERAGFLLGFGALYSDVIPGAMQPSFTGHGKQVS
jgi:hypothetical protein